MKEEVIDGGLRWLFFPDQCRHCVEAPCLETAGEPSAIYQDPATGAVLYTLVTRELDTDSIVESCPYNIPRKTADGTLAKCDMCNDRVHNGKLPACVQTCPTGAMNFGEREAMLSLARQRLAMLSKKYPKAQLLDPDDVRVVYLVAYPPDVYHEFAIAARSHKVNLTRQMALRRMVRPLTRAAARMG